MLSAARACTAGSCRVPFLPLVAGCSLVVCIPSYSAYVAIDMSTQQFAEEVLYIQGISAQKLNLPHPKLIALCYVRWYHLLLVLVSRCYSGGPCYSHHSMMLTGYQTGGSHAICSCWCITAQVDMAISDILSIYV